MHKNFQLNGHQFTIVAIATDQSQQQLGQIAIYREADSTQFLAMPLVELRSALQAARPVDWSARIYLYRRRFVVRSDVYAERYFNELLGN